MRLSIAFRPRHQRFAFRLIMSAADVFDDKATSPLIAHDLNRSRARGRSGLADRQVSSHGRKQ